MKYTIKTGEEKKLNSMGVGKMRKMKASSIRGKFKCTNDLDYNKQTVKSFRTRSIIKLGLGILGGVGLVYLIGKQKPALRGTIADLNKSYISNNVFHQKAEPEIIKRSALLDILTSLAYGIVTTIITLKMRLLKNENDTLETYLQQVKKEVEREQHNNYIPKTKINTKKIS